jgi:transcription elongation factor GreA
MSTSPADVRIGSRVRVRDRGADGGAVEEFQIVDPHDVAPQLGRISSESPLGRALLGRRVGDTVHVRTPGGLRVVTVLEVG